MTEKIEQASAGVASVLNAELCVDDKKRLDWLETNTDFTLRFHKKHWRCTKNTEYEFNVYKTMREAIDAAMNGTWQDQTMTLATYLGRNLTLDNELKRTAEMLVEITEKQGIYFAIAFLHDSSYDLERISKLLPILEAQKGAMKSEAKHD